MRMLPFILSLTVAWVTPALLPAAPSPIAKLPPAEITRALLLKANELYPKTDSPVFEFFLPVGDGHHVRVECSGNLKGIPLVYMHGGPGFPPGPVIRQIADPTIFRIIQVDQRGAGASYQENNQPLAKNETPNLVEDFEKVRRALRIERWIVMGGSWGSTLALLYAEKFPQRTSGLILRGVYLGRPQDTQSLYGPIAATLYPQLWQRFASYVAAKDRGDLLGTYFRMMTKGTLQEQRIAVHAADEYEGSLIHARVQPLTLTQDQAFPDLAGMSIEFYYITHQMFLSPNEILDKVDVLRKARLPTLIIHGVDDHIVSIKVARELAQALPEAQLVELPDTGHSLSEPKVLAALVAATKIFAGK